ncbi:hypothetical protein [Caproiciproducens faecalis]|uniref:Uncharacterized protein n=1 Tax=Caproiciproducens faecalis TaxID=2820301 RepID=A0ABS7DQL7_9FIRM|nr:hypothetical protein [Caproiciproducens faecalis]MBW7573411.1 hypothetical protein [Caproiciproducens faecalis]
MNNCYGEKLIALAAAISIQIAQCVTNDELIVLAALFTAIGDQLTLLATANSSSCSDNPLQNPAASTKQKSSGA